MKRFFRHEDDAAFFTCSATIPSRRTA